MKDLLKDTVAWILGIILALGTTFFIITILGYFLGLGISVITPIQLTTLNSLKLGLSLVALHVTIVSAGN